MCDRVVLVLAGPTAEMLHELVQSRICTLEDTECNVPAISAQMARERRLLADVAGALKAPR